MRLIKAYLRSIFNKIGVEKRKRAFRDSINYKSPFEAHIGMLDYCEYFYKIDFTEKDTKKEHLRQCLIDRYRKLFLNNMATMVECNNSVMFYRLTSLKAFFKLI